MDGGDAGCPAPKRPTREDRGVVQKSLFREEAMDKVLSPDELDRLMRVTDPKGWLALIALLALVAAAVVWGVFGSLPVEVGSDKGVLLGGDSRNPAVSQTSGLVTDVLVKIGDHVQEGQVLARVRPNEGAETDVVSLFDGRVDQILIEKGMFLERGQQVAVIKRGNEPLQAFVFVPGEQGKQLKKGMEVHVLPSTVKAEEFGFIQGKVTSVSKFPVTEDEMLLLLENQSLVEALRTGVSPHRVDVNLLRDPSTPSGFKWSSSQGPPFAITRGTLCTATFVLDKERPVNLVLPSSAG
jgi:multidrug efflux pump subunit AcrA (membrane-fusion protein)